MEIIHFRIISILSSIYLKDILLARNNPVISPFSQFTKSTFFPFVKYCLNYEKRTSLKYSSAPKLFISLN